MNNLPTGCNLFVYGFQEFTTPHTNVQHWLYLTNKSNIDYVIMTFWQLLTTFNVVIKYRLLYISVAPKSESPKCVSLLSMTMTCTMELVTVTVFIPVPVMVNHNTLIITSTYLILTSWSTSCQQDQIHRHEIFHKIDMM